MASSPLFHHLIISILLLLSTHPSPATAQTHQNITLGSSLSPVSKNNNSWISPSGDFAFGFRPLETNPDLFLLAIWFDKIPNKTVVWYPTGKTPVQDGSKVELTTDGLSLKDRTGEEVWNAATTNADHASMLDTGNFIIAKADSSVLWQSFQKPSDTILPTQVLSLGTQLSSRLMDTDYSTGRFQLAVQTDGNLVSYPVNIPTGFRYDPYFATDTEGLGSQLVFNESGNIYFAEKNGTQHKITSSSMGSLENFYQRAILEPDGVFRQYRYPKNGTGDGGWTEDWAVVDQLPLDICGSISVRTGSGACGFNSYCKLDVNQRADCECPPQYSFLDPTRKYKGCKPDFAAQSCEPGGPSADALFHFEERVNTDWPQSDYEQLNRTDEDSCRQNCLNDCFCAVAIFRDGSCWKKKNPLSNGRMSSDVSGKALIKVSKATNSSSQIQPSNTIIVQKDRGSLILVGSVLLGTSVFANCLLIATILGVVFCSCSKRKNLQPGPSLSDLNLRSFTYQELQEATNGFSQELGRGGFGTVYKGVFASEPRSSIAVKRLDNLLKESEKEFTNEVRSIGRTHHRNLVRLFGFCNEGTHRLLVYEFMSNGSLTSFLFGCVRPDWNQRVQIAFGIARGLMYLHEECSTPIIHCDIKPQNILLDDNFVARISDFGLAKLLKTDQTRTNTGIRGTRGYVAPEWFKSMAITAKVDVYSYGVMLLEIISCRRNVEPDLGNEERTILTDWANDCFRDGRVELLVEKDEEAMADMRRLERFVMVGIWCIQEEPSLRPSMKKVTQMLEGAVGVPVPPDPSSYISSIN